MPPSLLDSQLQTLDEPQEEEGFPVITVNIELDMMDMINIISDIVTHRKIRQNIYWLDMLFCF